MQSSNIYEANIFKLKSKNANLKKKLSAAEE